MGALDAGRAAHWCVVVVNIMEPDWIIFSSGRPRRRALDVETERARPSAASFTTLRVVPHRTAGDIAWETAIDLRALDVSCRCSRPAWASSGMVFDNNRQIRHDKIAGTVVVRVPRSQPLA